MLLSPSSSSIRWIRLRHTIPLEMTHWKRSCLLWIKRAAAKVRSSRSLLLSVRLKIERVSEWFFMHKSKSLRATLNLAVTNAAMDLSPVLLGVLFTLVLLCFVIFAKVYCYRSTIALNDSRSNRKHKDHLSTKGDVAKVSSNSREAFRLSCSFVSFVSLTLTEKFKPKLEQWRHEVKRN